MDTSRQSSSLIYLQKQFCLGECRGRCDRDLCRGICNACFPSARHSIDDERVVVAWVGRNVDLQDFPRRRLAYANCQNKCQYEEKISHLKSDIVALELPVICAI